MTDERSPDRELAWYRARWEELTDLLSVSDPEAVVDEVRRLQARAVTLSRQHQTLVEAGMDDSEQALRMIENMADQLEQLYAERDRSKPQIESKGESGSKGEDV